MEKTTTNVPDLNGESFVPTHVWTHREDRSPFYYRIMGTMTYVIVTTLACAVATNVIIINFVLFGAVKLGVQALEHYGVRVSLRKRLDELYEFASGWPINVGAWMVCYALHSFGIWEINFVGPKPSVKLSLQEWDQWRAEHERLNSTEDVMEVPLPRLAALTDRSSDRFAGSGAASHMVTTAGGGVCGPPTRPDDFAMAGGCMVVCNHMSNADGFVLMSALSQCGAKAVIKAGVLKAPYVGQVLWATGQCFIWGRGQHHEAADKEATFRRCAEVINNNVAIICYPEGTRRLFGRMNPFKLGMIGAALDYGWPIYVSVIHGSHRAWPPRELLMNQNPIYIRFDQSVIIPRKQYDTPAKIAQVIRGRMLRLMDGIPGYDAKIERPLQNSSDLQKIVVEARRLGDFRESFLG